MVGFRLMIAQHEERTELVHKYSIMDEALSESSRSLNPNMTSMAIQLHNTSPPFISNLYDSMTTTTITKSIDVPLQYRSLKDKKKMLMNDDRMNRMNQSFDSNSSPTKHEEQVAEINKSNTTDNGSMHEKEPRGTRSHLSPTRKKLQEIDDAISDMSDSMEKRRVRSSVSDSEYENGSKSLSPIHSPFNKSHTYRCRSSRSSKSNRRSRNKSSDKSNFSSKINSARAKRTSIHMKMQKKKIRRPNLSSSNLSSEKRYKTKRGRRSLERSKQR